MVIVTMLRRQPGMRRSVLRADREAQILADVWRYLPLPTDTGRYVAMPGDTNRYRQIPADV